jgi:hypothetical protein
MKVYQRMSRKKPAAAAAQSAAAKPVAAPLSQVPDRAAFALPPRLALPIALALIALAIIRVVSTYHISASTSDEPAHIACGLEYLAHHTYRLETQHPPLSRAFIALLPYLSGTRPRGHDFFQPEGWDIITYENHPDLTMTRMRLGVLPFFVLACLVTFYWTRRYFGPTAAVIATALFTWIPPVLAHAGLATTDMALAACLGLAFYTLLRWAEEPGPVRAAVAGLSCGLAGLSKYTALGFLPMAVLFALLAYLAAERPARARLIELAKARASGAAIIAITACLTIWAAYFFSWSHGPAPEYFQGISIALQHNHNGHPAWLLGQQRDTGWWYYFLVALAVKTPVGVLLLFFAGIRLCWKNRAQSRWLVPLAFALGILLPAMQGNVNIGVRHILPIYIAICMVAALAVENLLRRPVIPVVLLLWIAASGAIHHPDYIPYFNESILLLGPPDTVLVDSDYDWGQDTKRLAARLRQLGAKEVNWGWLDSPDNHFLETYPGLPHIVNIHPLHPAPGWTAVRPTLERISQYGLQYRYPDLKPWYMSLTPREQVGTIWLYYLDPSVVAPGK